MLQYFIAYSQGVNKFNITGAQMFDSINHMTDFFLNHIFGVKHQDFAILWASFHNITRICISLVVY